MSVAMNHTSTVSETQVRRVELQRRSEFLQSTFLGSIGDELFTVFYLGMIATTVLYLYLR
jgi:hypothetical protein